MNYIPVCFQSIIPIMLGLKQSLSCWKFKFEVHFCSIFSLPFIYLLLMSFSPFFPFPLLNCQFPSLPYCLTSSRIFCSFLLFSSNSSSDFSLYCLSYFTIIYYLNSITSNVNPLNFEPHPIISNIIPLQLCIHFLSSDISLHFQVNSVLFI